jgi:hypothetical protein
MKNKLIVAAPIVRKSGPWVGAATLFLVAMNDLRTKKN